MDNYSNFASLEKNEKYGLDFVILSRHANSAIALIAPHGGDIEPGTLDIADAIAGNTHTFYGFKGIKKSGNRILHITSTHFDEPLGLQTSENASVVIAVHGCHNTQSMIFIGGRNRRLKESILSGLLAADFKAAISHTPGLRGIDPDNICNRCSTGEGVQLEISRGLREKMFDNLDHRSQRKKTTVFYRFIQTVRASIA